MSNNKEKQKISPYLIKVQEIKKWMIENNAIIAPSPESKSEKAEILRNDLRRTRYILIKPYLELKTEEEKEEYRKRHPQVDEVIEVVNWIDKNNRIHLRNAREIKKWMIEKETTKPPARYSEDETERRLEGYLQNIRSKLIKPFSELTTEEEKEEFRKKHPEIDEVLEIINWIDENNRVHLRNIKEVKKWMEEKETTKPPAQDSKDEAEKKLGNALDSARKRLIKPFLELKTEEEKEEYRKEHPEIDEVLEIINWIDENNRVYLRNAKEALKWMEKNETTKAPSKSSVYDKERKLGTALEHIKYQLIKPYLELETEEEKEKYREEHPEIHEVMETVIEIYKDDNKKARQRLSELMKQDLEKRAQVAEAKELEKRYEEELEKREGNTKEEGVIHDEQ